ncbi:class I SAM-dependent rRNA methyltransferase [Paraburkholderia caballeronis]|uniref:SAM-dependent methyltransferase /23S rRNA m(5)C-1962 methyltransferase n=1 Tax=Paraburkholderia caballeronis TaxID=416943 RepID=A0A1H7HEQ0_9BURK|nr:class I SAM-dependent rRNA methyltransferase [Paraburkholderia caballeronis]PXW29533.1 SAM-dependent methyltransferase /23S rRNA m(5)C-1962 methyltransferase [Paraburkholderia caballeronis]PXX04792.1 SAM-dependent methyltransferase /23S rRNA m(5)C-1962 methyltransferase [Paraburkholderia caballeronis]RAK05853.1 SAM-dependent methyltransferase /23S rRNA m(5)C-1962 methyltransferase [Paraburkholderia caballeronis]SEB42148.1 SAM-dependent methyltransferase /23S rRNA m(5)C-1962 methyltransferase
MNTVTLKPSKEKSLLRRHPWVYANAIDRVDGKPALGATVIVRAHDGRFLARAAYSPHSQIRARVWSFDENEPIDHAFFKRRVQRAVAHRRAMVRDTGAVRLIFGEADGLPGLIVDQYDAANDANAHSQLVCQFMAAGVEAWKEAIVAALIAATGCPNVYERSDVSIREKEGLEQTTGVLAGDPPADTLVTIENGVRYHVDVRNGHKTGFYIDQRDNRALVQAFAGERDVLNCFCYTGGFSLAALKGGAKRVVSIDSSGEALALAQQNVATNGFDAARATWLDADAFKTLRRLYDDGERFDLVVLDPPKFAPSREHVDRAARAYKDINLTGLKLLRPGGLLFTYSCSGAIDAELFQKIVAGAAADARVDARILKRLGAGVDHPLLTAFPEGEYLKGLLLQIA